MVISELYRVIEEHSTLSITQDECTYYEGVAEKLPMSMMDCSIKEIYPMVVNGVETLVIELCE